MKHDFGEIKGQNSPLINLDALNLNLVLLLAKKMHRN